MCVIIFMSTCNMALNSSIFQVIIAVRPITLVMGKISYEDKARIETLRKLGFGYRTIVAKFPEKGWKLCSVNGLMSVGQQRNESQVAVSRKQHEQRKMLDTLSCWLAKIEHWLWSSATSPNIKLIKIKLTCEDIRGKQMRKILCKIFLHYIDGTIFALGYFILPHPV